MTKKQQRNEALKTWKPERKYATYDARKRRYVWVTPEMEFETGAHLVVFYLHSSGYYYSNGQVEVIR